MLLTFLFFFMRAAIQNVSPYPTDNSILQRNANSSQVFSCQLHLFLDRLVPPLPSIVRRVHNRRTLGILAAADLDELLDVGDFGRHVGGVRWSSRGDFDVAGSSQAGWPAKLWWAAAALKRAHGLCRVRIKKE